MTATLLAGGKVLFSINHVIDLRQGRITCVSQNTLNKQKKKPKPKVSTG